MWEIHSDVWPISIVLIPMSLRSLIVGHLVHIKPLGLSLSSSICYCCVSRWPNWIYLKRWVWCSSMITSTLLFTTGSLLTWHSHLLLHAPISSTVGCLICNSILAYPDHHSPVLLTCSRAILLLSYCDSSGFTLESVLPILWFSISSSVLRWISTNMSMSVSFYSTSRVSESAH